MPILFGGPALQRVLSCVSKYGPIRVSDAFTCSLGDTNWPVIKVLLDNGLLVRWGGHFHYRLLALNPGHPFSHELRRLFKAMSKTYQFDTPALPVSVKDRKAIPTVEVTPAAALKMFVWPSRTRILAAIVGLGRKATSTRIKLALRCLNHNDIKHALKLLAEQDIVEVRNGVFSLSRRLCFRRELIMLMRAVLSRDSVIKSAVESARAMKLPKYKRVIKIDWTGKVKGAVRPRGFAPRENGAPLLFGTDARYRLLSTLAHNGALRRKQLDAVADVTDGVINAALNKGLVVRYGPRYRKAVALNPSLPVSKELRMLLKCLWRRFPTGEAKLGRADDDLSAVPVSRHPWRGDIEFILGLPSRTMPLLFARLLGSVDVSSLMRLLPSISIKEHRRTFQMLVNQGVMKTSKEGNAKTFSLNESYFAFRELAALLDAIAREFPKYRTAASLEEVLMPRLRLQMRRRLAA